MFKSLVKKLAFTVAGKKKYQPLFERLHQYTLTCMNIGGGAHTDDSGEKKALQYINRKLQHEKNLVLLDVGANVGHYSILLKEVFGEKASISAFEPSLKTFQKLQGNIKNRSNIQLYNFAMGSEEARVTLYSNAEGSGIASTYKRRLDHLNVDMNLSEEIEVRTVDSFCREKKIDHIHFMKMDVEGHEIKVLNGAQEMLDAGKIDFIQFEFGGSNIDSRTYFQDFYYMLKDNYRIYRIVRDGLYEIKKYKESAEIFITTNYIAIKR